MTFVSYFCIFWDTYVVQTTTTTTTTTTNNNNNNNNNNKKKKKKHDRVGKVIHWELDKRYRIDPSSRFHPRKSDSYDSLGLWDTTACFNSDEKVSPRVD